MSGAFEPGLAEDVIVVVLDDPPRYYARGVVREVSRDGRRHVATSDGRNLAVPLEGLRPPGWVSDSDSDLRWIDVNGQQVLMPPGWAVRVTDGKVEYMLALVADSPQLAEQMAAEEADRFVVAFAAQVAEWLRGSWDVQSGARDEYNSLRDRKMLASVAVPVRIGRNDATRPQHFEEWCAEQIIRASRKERTLP